MSERETKKIERLSEIVATLPEAKKERLLGIAEGMAIMKEKEVQEKEVV